MECKRLVDVLKQPKKNQQDKAYHGPCGLISLKNDPLFLCSIQISEWVRVRMKMKQDRRDPLITHCGGSDGRCLVTKRTWCFCEFAGAHGSPTEPCKLLGNTWFESVRRALYQFLRSAPGVIVTDMNSLRRICTTSLHSTLASPISGVGPSIPNKNSPSQ
jgi:hypothetical protein